MIKKVQYGCGLSAPRQWENFDSSVTLRLQKLPLVGRWIPSGPFGRFPANVRVGDIVQGLPLDHNSVDLMYCSHVLEHLALDEFRLALANTYRLLKQGGTFRLVLPDLEAKARAYVASDRADAVHLFMEETYLGKKQRDRSWKGKLRDLLRNDQHLWMWDFKSMKVELEREGFTDVRRAFYHDSDVPDFREVEEASRWMNELGVECRK